MARKKAQGSKKKTVSKASKQAASSKENSLAETPSVVESPVIKTEPEVAAEENEPKEEAEKIQSVQAQTHAKARAGGSTFKQKRWVKAVGITTGVLALVAIVAAGSLGQFYKNKTMPGVFVAGINSGAKKPEQLKTQLEKQINTLQLNFKADTKTLTPKPKEIGYQVDITKTLQNAKNAKRSDGFLAKILFWKRVDVPAVVSVNDTLLNQYLETNIPEITKAPVDAQLQFDSKQSAFIVTKQADGQGADIAAIKQAIKKNSYSLNSTTISVGTAKRSPTITESKLTPLVSTASELTEQSVVLTGLGYTYKAKPSDIAQWLTPTPQRNGSVKLVVDSAKIQSYVDGISKRISSIPVDKKILKDETTGAEIVIQEGRDGTELAGKQELSAAIAAALSSKTGTTQTMNIQTAAFKTVNMNVFEKWIEVDLSEQRTTAYERTTPIKNFLIASGTRGHETVTGEFAIWHKNRTQTMQGGSKADGSYYSIPNVEWVSYFYKDYALHGAWWREKFGAPASHGCVNMTNADARWLYEWAPIGTKVIVHQ